ncbi:AraC family transcriptional regulator [Paenibacillus tarimensis]
MKIMICDDEVIIRTGLAKVINWRELGLTLLEPAASAEEVLARLEAERPDILLTDIRMTGITGLELAEEASKTIPELEVIILSGYDDFIYMQNAIRQNVSDYLLKTSKPEEIIKTVLRVKQRIEKRWMAQSEESVRSRREQQRALEQWVTRGEVSSAESVWPAGFLSDCAASGGRSTSGMRILLIAAEGWDESAGNRSLLLFAVSNALNDLFPCVSFVQKRRVVTVVREWAAEIEAQQQRYVFQRIERVLKCKLYVIKGKQVKRLEELHDSYRSADIAFDYKALMQVSEWSYEDVEDRRGGKTVCSVKEEKELCSILLEDDRMAVKRWVQQYIQELAGEPHVTPQTFEAALQSAALAAHRWLHRTLASSGREHEAETHLGPLEFHEDQTPYEMLSQHLYAVMKLYHHQLAEGRKSHVTKAIAYIENNLRHNLSLQQVAQHVHLHPGHLSTVFKKETGMTYRDYVHQIKMRHAMNFLSAYPAKISEVAAEVGYDDVKYFGQIFKKYTGQTPSEYREDPAVKKM